MKLFNEILIKVLEKEDINIVFPNLTLSEAEIIEMESYKALQAIKAIIENDSLDDFMCIEEITSLFESMGSGCDGRHDFG